MKRMNYKIVIKECINHSRLPFWALYVCSDIKGYYGDIIVEGNERLNLLRTVQSNIKDNIRFVVRNTENTGKDIPSHLNEEELTLTVFSLTGNRPYLEIGFECTEKDPWRPFLNM